MQEDVINSQLSSRIKEIVQAATLHQSQLTNFGLSRGILGLALLHYLYGEWTHDSQRKTEVQDLFNEACSRLSEQTTAGFTLDLSELGIVTEYFHRKGILDIDINEFLSDVDVLLQEQLQHYLEQGNIGGFVNGALSMGLYFLHRLDSDRPRFSAIMNQLVAAIEHHALREEAGIYWRSFFRPQEKCVYLTFPHGSAAILLFLTTLAERGVVPRPTLAPLVSQGISFLLAQEVKDQYYSFSDLLHSSDESRLALCYGDLGVGYSLLRAGQVFGQAVWVQKGHDILHKAAGRRDEQTSKVKDAGILFGATGLALAFLRIYELTGVPLYQQTANYWLETIPTFATHGNEFAGFQSAYNQWHLHTNVSFCEGIIGIGIGLMKFANPSGVDIDEFLWLF